MTATIRVTRNSAGVLVSYHDKNAAVKPTATVWWDKSFKDIETEGVRGYSLGDVDEYALDNGQTLLIDIVQLQAFYNGTTNDHGVKVKSE